MSLVGGDDNQYPGGGNRATSMPLPPGPPKSPYRQQIDEILAQYPGYQSAMTPDGSGLANPYKMESPESSNQLRGEYFGKGMTGWGNAQIGRQGIDESNLRNVAAGDIMSARAGGMSNLAQSGGLSSGARERMTRASVSDQANRMQDISRAGMAKRADIGISDEATKASGRQFLSGQDLGIENFNKAQSINDLARQNNWSLDRARMEMQAMAAGNMADIMGQGQQFKDGVNPQDPTTWANTPNSAWSTATNTYGRGWDAIGAPKGAQYVINPMGSAFSAGGDYAQKRGYW